MTDPRSAVILAAGQGTRMASPTPKVLFDVCGLPAVVHVARAARDAGFDRLVVVVSAATGAMVGAALRSHGFDPTLVEQEPPRGTGHAVLCALPALPDGGRFVVLYGDGPLYSAETLRSLEAEHAARDAAETLLTAYLPDPTGYGRVVRASDGRVERIVEELDADEATRAILEVNTGIAMFETAAAREALAAITPDNAKKELYLTDAVAILAGRGAAVAGVACPDPAETASFNSIEELAAVRARMQATINAGHMRRGVDIVDPATAWIDADVTIGPGTRILPSTVIGRGVVVGPGCVVGPFAHLRGAARLEEGAEIGNFVEVKKSTLGPGAKAKHLTYLGDAEVGARANIGCGTITANYDGRHKHPTRIGERAFVGSGTVLIAPTELGDGATTGAGAVVRRNTRIGPGEIWVGVPARRLGPPAAPAANGPDDDGGGEAR